MQSSRVPKSSSTTSTTSATGTSVTASRVSQPCAAAGQRQQGSFVGFSTTIHTPESVLIPATYHQQDELGLLSSEIDTTQIAPFEAAAHPAVTFDDDHQGRSASPLSLFNEPARSQKSSQSVDDVPIVREEQSSDPTETNKWIIVDKSQERPYQCGYLGCDKNYKRRHHLKAHLIKHTGTSKFKCPHPECVGNEYFRDSGMLKRHIAIKHTLEKPFRCERCYKLFARKVNLKYHWEHAHSRIAKKKSRKIQSASESSSATTTANTANTANTSTITSRVYQPELAAGQLQQGSFADLWKTVHTPEPTLIPATYYQKDELGLLPDMSVSDVSPSQVDPFEILATHQTVTFEDLDQFQEQEQLGEFPLLFDELLQPLNDFDPMASEAPDNVNPSILPDKNDERIINRTAISIPEYEILPPPNNDYFRQGLTGIVPEALLVGITGDPKLPSSRHQAYQRPDPTDKWIILTGDKKKPFKCGYEGCDRRYTRKNNLRSHFVKHTGDSPYKCYMGECTGEVAFYRQDLLIRHIRSEHTFERPYQCDVCDKRFMRSDHLLTHKRRVHSIENEKKSSKRKKK